MSRTAELHDETRRAERPIRQVLADIDIGSPDTTRPAAVEEELRHTGTVVLEIAGGAVVEHRIDAGAEVDRRLPVEGIVHVPAVRDPDVVGSQAAGPVAAKNSRCSSRDSAATASRPAVLTAGPRWAGGPHGSFRLARCDTQMSVEPYPPGRSEWKYRLNPFLEMAGPPSAKVELTTGPRFTGADQSEKFEIAG